MSYIEACNEANMRNFAMYGTKRMRDVGIYTCVLCKRTTSIESSYSNNGRNLICSSCFNRKFKTNPTAGFEWMEADHSDEDLA